MAMFLVKAVGLTSTALIGVAGYRQYKRSGWIAKLSDEATVYAANERSEIPHYEPLPTRAAQISTLRSDKIYDVVVIGGGATGCGVALDSATRGLSTVLLEKYDFSSGTSSRSTKLIHGGVRYLQKAVFNLDIEQYKMVREALHERANLCKVAPHLAYHLPIMLPIYKWYKAPYFWAGIKAYDLVAGSQKLRSSYYLNFQRTLDEFPMLSKDKLKCSLVYYDGAHDDARTNVALALTAVRNGAVALNHAEVTRLHKTDQRLSGVRFKDSLTGEEFTIRARCVVNATGPFTDSIRSMDRPEVKPICKPSSGVHIVLPDYYSPASMGLLDPETSDGRVIFFLPWLGRTIAGTTDTACPVVDNPAPTEADIQFILSEIRNYLSPEVRIRRGDVLSAWSGIRPLVMNPAKTDTQSLARNHIIEVSPSNLITIAGGKWTTYRSMAMETIDKAIEVCGLNPRVAQCQTDGLVLEGGVGWSPTLPIRLVQTFGLDSDVAKHLSATYGVGAYEVARKGAPTGLHRPAIGIPLAAGFPYIEAEVRHAVAEYAATVVDVVARRTRLAFLSTDAAEMTVDRIAGIMGDELGWDAKRTREEIKKANEFIYLEMGAKTKDVAMQSLPLNLTPTELKHYTERFNHIDGRNKGYITLADVRGFLDSCGQSVSDEQLMRIFGSVDLNRNGLLELSEFLTLVVAVKGDYVMANPLSAAVMPPQSGGPKSRGSK